MDGFRRRTYGGLGELLSDAWNIVNRPDEVLSLAKGQLVTSAFRERLMLVVTAVNECRYCSYGHTRAALASGLTIAEIEDLHRGQFEYSPPHEVPALLYAQHWAETDGKPDPEARRKVIEHYDELTVRDVEVALRMIRVGNLTGNTLDKTLWLVSGGRWGG